MEFNEILKRRYSCRSYNNKKVKDDDLNLILNNAILAPNAGNLQAWRFIVVKDDVKREQIATACLQQKWMFQAPIHIIIAADVEYVKKNYGDKDQMYCIQDCTLAASNIILTATSLNLDTCFVSAFDKDMLKRALNIPENIIPYIVITLGYSDNNPEEKKRYNLSNMVFFDNYGSKMNDKSIFPLEKQKQVIQKQQRNLFNKIREKLIKHTK